nr:conotoxin precursor A [Conus judaeus]
MATTVVSITLDRATDGRNAAAIAKQSLLIAPIIRGPCCRPPICSPYCG